jgi:hypothetical protein
VDLAAGLPSRCADRMAAIGLPAASLAGQCTRPRTSRDRAAVSKSQVRSVTHVSGPDNTLPGGGSVRRFCVDWRLPASPIVALAVAPKALRYCLSSARVEQYLFTAPFQTWAEIWAGGALRYGTSYA